MHSVQASLNTQQSQQRIALLQLHKLMQEVEHFLKDFSQEEDKALDQETRAV